MKSVTHTAGVLMAAVFLSTGSTVPAETQPPSEAERDEFFITLVEEIAVATVANSDEFRYASSPKRGMELVRQLYVQQAEIQRSQLTDMRAATALINRYGVADAETCQSLLGKFNTFIGRERVLADYDSKVELNINLGPELRSLAQIQESGHVLDAYLVAVKRGCRFE